MTDAPFADSAPRRRRDRDRAAGAPGDVDSWAHLVGLDGRPADGGPPTGPGSPDEPAGSGTPEPLSRRAARLREARTDTDSPTGPPPPGGSLTASGGLPLRPWWASPAEPPDESVPAVPPAFRRPGAGRLCRTSHRSRPGPSGTQPVARQPVREQPQVNPWPGTGAARVAGTRCGQRPACLRPHLRRPPRPRSGGPRARRAAGRAAQARRDRTAAGGPRSRAGTAGPGGAAAAGRRCNRRAGVGGRPRPRPPRAAVSRSARARAARCRAVRAPRPGGAAPSSRTGQWRSPDALDGRRGGDDRGARSEACPGRRRRRRGQGLPGGALRAHAVEATSGSCARPFPRPEPGRPAPRGRSSPGGRRQPRGHSDVPPPEPPHVPAAGGTTPARGVPEAPAVSGPARGDPRNGQPHAAGGRRRRRGRRRPRRRGGDRPRGAGLPPPRRSEDAQARADEQPAVRSQGAHSSWPPRVRSTRLPTPRRRGDQPAARPYLPSRRPSRPGRADAPESSPRPERAPDVPWRAHARAGQGDDAVRPAPPPR